MGTKSPDETMENSHASYDVEDPSPKWYTKFSRFVGLLFLAVALTVPVVLEIKFGSIEGTGVVLYLILVVLTPFLWLVRGVAIAHRKFRFAKSLPLDRQATYMALLKQRYRKFLIVFILSVIAMAIFIGLVLYVDKIAYGKGWF